MPSAQEYQRTYNAEHKESISHNRQARRDRLKDVRYYEAFWKAQERFSAISERDWGWLEGIIDGEGCLFLHRNAPHLSVGNTTRDIVEKVARLLGEPTIYTEKRKGNAKDLHRITISGGRKARNFALLKVLLTKLSLIGKEKQ